MYSRTGRVASFALAPIDALSPVRPRWRCRIRLDDAAWANPSPRTNPQTCNVAAHSQQVTERTALTEATVTILGEGGVIRNLVFQT